MSSVMFDDYKNYVRPELAELMSSLGLDVSYTRARGNKLYYTDDNGRELEVTDFLGGYGAGLFGHNHPELVSVLINALKSDKVFSGQASIRPGAGELAKKLSREAGRFTKTEFVTVFGNSGAEAVEIALKHSLLVYRKKADTMAAKFFVKYRFVHNSPAIPIVKPHHPEWIPGFSGSEQSDLLTRFFDHPELPGYLDATNIHVLNRLVRQENLLRLSPPPAILALKDAFHGKTNLALHLTTNPAFRQTVSDAPANIGFVSTTDDIRTIFESHRKYLIKPVIRNQMLQFETVPFTGISAFFAEPIQGEGGINVMDKDFAYELQRLCNEYDIPIVADEIQCGMGRTGTFLYSEQINLKADVFLLGKSLGGGISKISAALFDKRYFDPHFSVLHSSTFAEDELSTAVALESLQLVTNRPDVSQKIRSTGLALRSSLESLHRSYPDVIKSIRGRGLMLGIEFRIDSVQNSSLMKFLAHYNYLGYVIAGYLLKHHLIRIAPTLSKTNVIRIEPSYLIENRDIDQLVQAFDDVCKLLRDGQSGELIRYTVNKKLPEFTYTGPGCDNVNQTDQPDLNVKSAAHNKVAFIGHFITPMGLALWDPGFKHYSETEQRDLLFKIAAVAAPLVYNRVTVESLTGQNVQLLFIGLPICSEQIYQAMQQRHIRRYQQIISQAVQMAVDEGCTVAGLGGYSSIITRNGKDLDGNNIGITSGNAYTVAVGIQAILESAVSARINIAEKTVAIVGAGGNIGSVFARLLADISQQVLLIGHERSRGKLNDLASEIEHSTRTGVGWPDTVFNDQIQRAASLPAEAGGNADLISAPDLRYELPLKQNKTRVSVSTDLHDLRYADIIVTASNSPGAIIYPDMIKKSPVIINDISVPDDVDESVYSQRPSAVVIKGGIVGASRNPGFYIPGIPLHPGEMFSCMAETVLLGFEHVQNHFSFGDISKEQVFEIWNLARKHGLTLKRIKLEKSY